MANDGPFGLAGNPALTTATAVTIGGVNCWDEGVTENYSRTRCTAVRTIVCAWNSRKTVIDALMSNPKVIGNVSFFTGGAQYPDDENLYVESIPVEMVDGDTGRVVGPNGMVASKYARLHVTYASLDLGAVNVDFGSSVVHTPNSASWLKYVSDGKDVPVEDSPPLIVPGARVTRWIRNAPIVPVASIVNAIKNPRNSAPLALPGGNFDTGLVLFDGCKSQWRQTSSGNGGFDILVAFQTRAYDWNSVIDKTGAVRSVTRQNGDPLFGSSDLNALFL